MHIADLVHKNKFICPKCRGLMIREEWFDLPHGFYEFYCLNCGERIWIREEILKKPIYIN